jgi:hypothetical protein
MDRLKIFRCLVPALAALALAGCPGDLERQSRVSKLRVLAVRGEPPELVLKPSGPLPRTKLTALAVEPRGAPVSLRFALCKLLGDPPSPALPCPGTAGLDLPDAGPDSAELDLSDPRILALAAQIDGGVPADAGAALAQGIPILVGFTATADAGPPQKFDGFATIILRSEDRGPAARNPEITALQLQRYDALDGGLPGEPATVPDDGSATAPAGATLRLIPVTAPKDDPTSRFVFSFFATDGSISSLHSTDQAPTGELLPTYVDWTAPNHAGPVRLWVVLRDSKGGTAWLERSLLVH